ncbi:MAG TPA: primosomal protein N', partial [Desulfuromonadales bacterium]|nr:primosomal protein N' [Desulfuromonadales bacterium]
MTDPLHIIEVAIPLYLERTFHYLVPESLREQALSGRRALVPFGNRKLTGYILGIVTDSPFPNLKEIISVLDSEPLWTAKEFEFFRWTAAYYQHPLGEVVRTALPAGINIQTRKGNSGEPEVFTGGKTVRREKFYLPGPATPPLRQPSPKALEILAIIRDSGDVSAADLRKRFGACAPQLKRLTELGLSRVE